MVRALTRRGGAGQPYARPTNVEAEIEGALGEDRLGVRRRLLATDEASPGYLRSESLVYLVREGGRIRDEDLQNTALRVLLSRCAKILDSQIDDSVPHASDLREEVLSEFGVLLASDGIGKCPDELDYFEIRFNAAFKAFRVDVLRREKRRLDPIAELPSQIEERQPDEQVVDSHPPLLEVFQLPANQEDRVFRKEVWKTITQLPPEQRKALMLCSVLGYKVESTDPTETTAATLCCCTGRTIRNRLARAQAELARLMEKVCAPS